MGGSLTLPPEVLCARRCLRGRLRRDAKGELRTCLRMAAPPGMRSQQRTLAAKDYAHNGGTSTPPPHHTREERVLSRRADQADLAWERR